MVVPGGGLALSPAQRALVEKGLAARQTRAETDAIQKAIEAATRQHIEETKARCRNAAGGGNSSAKKAVEAQRDRDRRLIIRHVGEELARVAMRDSGGKKKPQPPGKTASAPLSDAQSTCGYVQRLETVSIFRWADGSVCCVKDPVELGNERK